MSDLTLNKLKKTKFENLYNKLLINSCTDNEYTYLLSISVILINSDDSYLNLLGYRIILLYTNQTNDFSPLYEISINKGFIPISKTISTKKSIEQQTFFTLLNEAYMENYHSNGIYHTLNQNELISFFSDNINNSVLINAPTSYGKTDLILTLLRNCPHKRICIITSTKALLQETKNRIKNEKIDWIKKIIIHPEMYTQNDTDLLCVLTQERLLRLLKNQKELSFDYVLLDEAQNLLDDDDRTATLTSVLILLNKRNSNTVFKFLSPFIYDNENLKLQYTKINFTEYKISEKLKSELFYIYNIREKKGLKLYDQFLDSFIDIDCNKELDEISFILRNKADKNIIYFNKPKDIESFTTAFISALDDIPKNDRISNAIKCISEYISPEYTLIKALKKGVIYHHGSIPDSIRPYIEYLYKTEKSIKYIITSSTLLEGINLPASKLFIMDNRKGRGYLSSSQLKNLVGRLCRFNDIFNPSSGTLSKLLPIIYFVFGTSYSKNAAIEKYIKATLREDKSYKDEVQNPLLENAKNTEHKEKIVDFIENFQEGTIPEYQKELITYPIAQSALLNNITEIDYNRWSKRMQERFDEMRDSVYIDSVEKFLDAIATIFLNYILDDNKYQNLLRLKDVATRIFYTMFINWQIDNLPFSSQIKAFLRYWHSLKNNGDENIVYVGKWGDETRGNSHYYHWIDVKKKTDTQLINLAVVKIKEEQDFVENTLLRFIEVFKDCNVIDDTFYNKMKYGTDNKSLICLLKNGFSITAAKLLVTQYSSFLQFDLQNELVCVDKSIIDKMKLDNVNDILVFEVENNI